MVIGIQDELLRLHAMGLLALLIADKTQRSGKTVHANRAANILWATDAYQQLGAAYARDREMQTALITGEHSDVIKNRARKAMEQQSERVRKRGEVFTPLWICQKMVSHADAVWFGAEDPFVRDSGTEVIAFPKKKKWMAYVDARRLEITCGEAPYLVQRYDVSTGEILPLSERQGILDRKLRIVGQQAADEAEWLKWAFRAFEATYGYEFQGDNVLIARANLLMTFEDYLQARWHRAPLQKEYEQLANIIAWNVWQMDGLTGRIPYCRVEGYESLDLFCGWDEEHSQEEINFQPPCRIYDWRRGNSLEYLDVNTGGRTMKFDFVIGNPPYQKDIDTKGDRANPIYNDFMEQSFKIADAVELITPARFLFNAGQTSKLWNKKMLNDTHFKVIYYEPNANTIFPTTDIKGGIAITIRNAKKDYGAIGVFTPYSVLNDIIRKVRDLKDVQFLNDIVSSRGTYRTTKEFEKDYPDSVERLGKGTGNMLVSNFFEKMPEAIVSDIDKDKNHCIKILCRIHGKRTFCYIKNQYIQTNAYIDKYNVASPEANASGKFGEKLTIGEILAPEEGATDTFLNIGLFSSRQEVLNLQKYMKTKFFRALLGAKKVTQHCPPAVWEMIPMQDFTDHSDIDWTKSIADIDQQLYKKYGLSEAEIQFIETHVKEMK